MESYHNYLRNHHAYAKCKEYIPDIISPDGIPEWNESKSYNWWLVNGVSIHDPKYGVEARGR